LVKQACAHSGTAVLATGPQSVMVGASQLAGGSVSELVGGSSVSEEPGFEVSEEPGAEVSEAGGAVVLLTSHDDVGLASTQSQSASTAPMTPMAVWMPQPSITQSWAASWMTSADSHWHLKSWVSQLATVTAADMMQDWAHSGTASALAWQGDTASQEVMGPSVLDGVGGSSEDSGGAVVSGGVSEDVGSGSAEDVGSGSLVLEDEPGSAEEVGSGSAEVGSADEVGSGWLVGSGTAVATQPQTERAAPRAATMSEAGHAERTQGSAVREMAAELAGVQRQPTSVVSVHPTDDPAAMMQEKAQTGNRVVRLRQADWAAVTCARAKRLTIAKGRCMIAVRDTKRHLEPGLSTS
jgi:hypothetical protein